MTVAIVGAGPRGIAVLERLTAHLSRVRSPAAERPRVVVIDAVELGRGRVWNADQPPWLLMNTVAGELTLAPPDGAACPLPSFADWLRSHADSGCVAIGPHDYAPRSVYGEYLRAVYDEVLAVLRTFSDVEEIQGRVVDIAEHGETYRLRLDVAAGQVLIDVAAVVLATGHAPAQHPVMGTRLAGFAAVEPELQHLSGGLVSELDLDVIPARAEVAVVGLGLSFYDLLLSLSVGRGGEFREAAGELVYEPSGKEPVLFAGSRTGMPLRTRGSDQKTASHRFRPRLLTAAALARLREASCRERGAPQLDFAAEVLPLLAAEVELVRLETMVRQRDGAERARQLAEALVATEPAGWDLVRRDFGLGEHTPIDLTRMARPFDGVRFRCPEDFTHRLFEELLADVAHAKQGNVEGPLKAGLDVIRDCRDLLRAAVEFDGVAARRPEEEFFTEFAPLLSHLSTGPPPLRTEQFLALARAGIVQVVGPMATFGFDAGRCRFTIESPVVPGSLRYATVLVDSRLRATRGGGGANPLLTRLCEAGLAEAWPKAAAGVRVTPANGRVLGRDRVISRGLYATGAPTEDAHWFTQVGNGRPGARTAFHREADSIALDIVRRGLCSLTRPSLMSPATST